MLSCQYYYRANGTRVSRKTGKKVLDSGLKRPSITDGGISNSKFLAQSTSQQMKTLKQTQQELTKAKIYLLSFQIVL